MILQIVWGQCMHLKRIQLPFQIRTNKGIVKVGHKGLNLWAISYSKGGCLLELQDCVELDV